MPDRTEQIYQTTRQVTSQYRTQLNNTKFSGEKPSTILYGIVMVIALLKDMLDMLGVTGFLIPVVMIFTFCFSALIYLLLMAFDRSGGSNNRKAIVLLVTTVIEMVPLLDFLPIETAAIFILYQLAKREWKKNEQQAVLNSNPQFA